MQACPSNANDPTPARYVCSETAVVPGVSRRFDIDDALWDIRAKFTVYLENGLRALSAALGIGRILERIKRGIRSGERGFPDTTWEAWCIRTHAANELPFGHGHANRYIQLWNHRGEITFEDDAASLRAGIAIIRGDAGGKTRRERWRAVYRCPPGDRKSSAHANGSGEATREQGILFPRSLRPSVPTRRLRSGLGS